MSFRSRHAQSTATFARRRGVYLGLVLAATAPFFLNPTAEAQPTLAQIYRREQAPSEANVIYVNPRTGNDQRGEGSERSPFKTITQALMLAEPKTVILLASGTYSAQTGENFPLLLKTEVTIKGNPRNRGRNVIIQGNGFFLSSRAAGQNVTIVASDRAGELTGVTVINSHDRGYGLWIESASPQVTHNTFVRNGNSGISVNGNSAPTIANNYFYSNGGNGLVVYGTSKPQVRENEFERTGVGVNAVENAAPLLYGNRISGNRIGVILEGNAQATLRNNIIENSTEYGLVAIAQSRADLGTAAEPGGNTFRGNRRLDIQNLADGQMISAFGNQLGGRTEGRIDLRGNTSALNVSASSPSRLPPLPISRASSPAGSRETPVLPSAGNSQSVSPSPNTLSSNRPLPSSPLLQSPSPRGTREIVFTAGGANSQSVSPSPNALSSNRPLSPPSIPQSPSPSGTREITFTAGAANSQPLPSPDSLSQSSSPRERREIVFTAGARNSQALPPSPNTLSNNRPLPPLTPQSSSPSGAREITVSPPEANSQPLPTPPRSSTSSSGRRSLSDLLVVTPRPVPNVNSSSGSNPNVLPVSKAPIPNSDLENLSRTTPIPGTGQEGSYRVMVERNISQEAQLLWLYPDAFPTVYKGQSMLEIGVFSSQENAEKTLQELKNLGLSGIIVQF
ncbi:MAG: DUF1565 domain-containing protein [Xenococcaceae cyanobacterium]